MGSLMESRRRILLNTPHIEYASGPVAHFNTDMAAKLEECMVNFLPKQAGSGEPSPSNVRAISGWDRIVLSHSGADTTNPDQTAVAFPDTVYGGYIDLMTGELIVDKKLITLTGNSGWSAVGSKFYAQTGETVPYYQYKNQVCNLYPYAGSITTGSAVVTEDKHMYIQRSSTTLSYNRIWVYDTDFTLEDFKDLLNQTPLQATHPIEPVTYQLTPQQIASFRGINNIWSDAGDVEVKFWTH